MRLPLAVVLLIFCSAANSKEVEAWACKDLIQPGGDVLVTATVEEGRKTGTIYVAGVTHKARFEVEGFDRRWDFGPLRDSSFRYAFIIKPNGDGAYYDFGTDKKTKPSNFMKCHRYL